MSAHQAMFCYELNCFLGVCNGCLAFGNEIHRKEEHAGLREKSGNAENFVKRSKYASCYDFSIQEMHYALFQKSKDKSQEMSDILISRQEMVEK